MKFRDEQTSLGVSPAEAFASLAGECTAAFSWNATSSDNLIVSPESGSSDITVTVTLDQGSARVVLPRSCGRLQNPPSMQVDAHVHLESKDGTFVVDADAPAQGGGGVLAALSFSVSSADLGGNLSIQPKDPGTSVRLSFTVEPFANGCVGTVLLDTMMSMPGGGSGAFGVFGSWSDTACSVGEESVAVDVPGQNGTPSLPTMINAAWSNAAYPGTWDDGTTTELTVELGALPETGCRDVNLDLAIFPVQITYGTADGRVQSHSARADLVVHGYSAPQPQLQLHTSEDLACDGATATLSYTPADCSALSRITMQLSLNSNTGANAGDLNVYEYAKTSNPSGPADAVQTLSLSVP